MHVLQCPKLPELGRTDCNTDDNLHLRGHTGSFDITIGEAGTLDASGRQDA